MRKKSIRKRNSSKESRRQCKRAAWALPHGSLTVETCASTSDRTCEKEENEKKPARFLDSEKAFADGKTRAKPDAPEVCAGFMFNQKRKRMKTHTLEKLTCGERCLS